MDRAWRQAPILWLTGVRRAGKTVLARSLPEAEYLNCDLPSSAMRLADPEGFFRALDKPLLILDEVHQLPDPSRLLKIAADAYPDLKVLATGSSTLAATTKSGATSSNGKSTSSFPGGGTRWMPSNASGTRTRLKFEG
jgi:predicted AAA+ superfamily ATPase